MGTAKPVILLIGGGHAHLGVLADWVRKGAPDASTILVTPDTHTRYSGMIPGTVAGQYAQGDGLIDLAPLARRTGTKLIVDRCVAIDPDRRSITLASGGQVEFDFCSIDTGGVGSAQDALGELDRLIDIRPISTFLQRLEKWTGLSGQPLRHLAVIGGGAGGVEIAFALRRRFDEGRVLVTLVAGAQGVLPGFGYLARRLARRELGRQGIALIEENAPFEGGHLVLDGRNIGSVDLAIASLGAAAPRWPGEGGLAVDEDGFIAVDRFQRSTSHPHILAAGDVASRQDRIVPRSGVHAVHTGPVLAANLRTLSEGHGALRSYSPRPASLYLLSTGEGEAIASYGPLAAQGRWAGRLKHRIDTQWVESFAKMGAGV